MKTICLIFYFSILLTACCGKLFKDDELSLKQMPYSGRELRTDGYYYRYWASYDSSIDNNTSVKFFYRNGIMLSAHSYSGVDLDIVEKEMISLYDELRKDKSGWGVFVVDGGKIQYSAWSTSVGGGLPAFRSEGIIENDTTFRITKSINSNGTEFEVNDVYHFRQFSPKPDSTNNFIK